MQARCAEYSASSTSSMGGSKVGGSRETYGQPATGVHAVQMELACRAYIDEPNRAVAGSELAAALFEQRAARPFAGVLRDVLHRCVDFVRSRGERS